MASEPRELGPYRLVRRLGVGGMAETFEAIRLGSEGFEQRVCLKRVLPAFSQDEEFLSRFRREARLAAQLRHTHIVGVIDFGEIDGAHFMALELVDGVDLRSFLKSSPGERLSPETVALIAMDLAYALEHAHATLVHRDISPSNILLSRSGETKLADFGIAKAIDNAQVTASRSAEGKIPYMSPEQMRGERVDARADLFSLGVVLFEAAAGTRPFDGAHDVETMQRILEGRRPSLAELAPELPEVLRGIIEQLIELDPGARIQTAAQLTEALAPVAPHPRVRRELARTIEGHRGGPGARLHVRAKEEERDTELSRPPVMRNQMELEAKPYGEEKSPPRRSRALIGLALLLAILGISAGASRWLGRAEEASTASSPAAVPGAAPAAESVTAAAPTAAMPSPPKDDASAPPKAPARAESPDKAARVGKGWVHVVVQPWGNVWIDGTWMGRAPVKARLSKGRHLIEVGREIPSTKRVVRVEPGSRKEVELSLAE